MSVTVVSPARMLLFDEAGGRADRGGRPLRQTDLIRIVSIPERHIHYVTERKTHRAYLDCKLWAFRTAGRHDHIVPFIWLGPNKLDIDGDSLFHVKRDGPTV